MSGEDHLAIAEANFWGDSRCDDPAPAQADHPRLSAYRSAAMRVPSHPSDRPSLLMWAGALAAVGLAFGLALLPPVLPPGPRLVLMEGFSSMCHQIPGRSPHLYGVPLAVCDRCIGIYGGLVLGVLVLPFCWFWRRRLSRYALPFFVGAGGTMGLDWVGPVLGAWPNLPATRFLTGALFGVALGMMAGWGLLRSERTEED